MSPVIRHQSLITTVRPNCGLKRHIRRGCRHLSNNKVHSVEEQEKELSSQKQFRDTVDSLARKFSKAFLIGNSCGVGHLDLLRGEQYNCLREESKEDVE